MQTIPTRAFDQRAILVREQIWYARLTVDGTCVGANDPRVERMIGIWCLCTIKRNSNQKLHGSLILQRSAIRQLERRYVCGNNAHLLCWGQMIGVREQVVRINQTSRKVIISCCCCSAQRWELRFLSRTRIPYTPVFRIYLKLLVCICTRKPKNAPADSSKMYCEPYQTLSVERDSQKKRCLI